MKTQTTYQFTSATKGHVEFELEPTQKTVFERNKDEFLSPKLNAPEFESGDGLPTFFEWQKINFNYNAKALKEDSGEVGLYINDRLLKTSKTVGEVRFLSHTLSFDDAIGKTTIALKDNTKQPFFELETEVFPQKMDYRSDYKAMMAELSDIIENLAFDELKDTFLKTRAKTSGYSTEVEWWAILDTLFHNLWLSLEVIRKQPKHEIQVEEKVVSPNKAKRLSKSAAKWFAKSTQFRTQVPYAFNVTEGAYFNKVPVIKKKLNYDVYENRFIVWSLKTLIKRAKDYHNHIDQKAGKKDRDLRKKRIKDIQSRLQGVLHQSPFNQVGEFEMQSHFSSTLTKGSGYREFVQIFLLLQRGLEIAHNDIFKIDVKNISTIYEYWCFCKIVQVLKEVSGAELSYQDLIKIERGKFNVQLKKGRASKVVFKFPNRQEKVEVFFNREFTTRSTYTFKQIPDYTIAFHKKGYEQPFWYLFDAKYRFNETKGESQLSFEAPDDAIGQLHRYRDAILHTEIKTSTYRQAIKNLGGIILYPYPDTEETFKGTNYYKSIAEVNIGAFPFLPSKIDLFQRFVVNLLHSSPEQHFESYIEMDRSEYDTKRQKWSELTLLGLIPKSDIEKRLDFINRHNKYAVRFIENTNSKIYGVKNLVLLNGASKSLTSLYKVVQWSILSKEELYDDKYGVNWNLSSEKYIVFDIKEKEKINKRIKYPFVASSAFRYTTELGLREYLDTQDEKALVISNPDAARLYFELKKRKIDFSLKWKHKSNDPSLVEFELTYKGISKFILSSTIFEALTFLCKNEYLRIDQILNQLVYGNN